MLALHYTRKKKMFGKKQRSVPIDYLVYAISFIGPLTTFPQLYGIWIEKNVAGVSFLTWTGYVSLAAIWLAYGIVHKEKPIIISNALWMVAESLVVLGIGVFRPHVFI
ncbi:MAG: hypothetical protein KGJ07_05935 [Patescibacteria group bacterium]|nr:hypothetical protein [Patescibacteria group bacterium]MDE2591139.1 hypothetical protein [Patescibacteria group bacterium]